MNGQDSRKYFRVCQGAGVLLALWLAMAHAVAGAPAVQEPAVFRQVDQQATGLAAKPWQAGTAELPPFLTDLNYDQYRDVRFQPAQSLWRKEHLPFEAQFFSRGSIFHDKVMLHVVDKGKVLPIDFRRDLFDFGRLPVPDEVPKDLGFAGFRLHYPINTRKYYDEVIAFLGASYFRAVGRNQVYGLSARGLALDTGLDKGEEFPVFREFWLEKPRHHAKQITLYALMDSPSVAGAYRFDITPGVSTRIHVTAHLHFRSDVQTLGIAPLTSMFYYGKYANHFIDDFRPEVHDSDGLLLVAGNGEQLWRPLNNPQRLALSYFEVANPRRFGLLQRERDFSNYQDLEASYQRRPGAWIEPVGDWGTGNVELVEIPTENEYHDNIVAFWVPEQPVTAGSSRSFEYNLVFGDDPEASLPGSRVIATRIGAGKDDGHIRFVIEFAGTDLRKLKDTAAIAASVSASSGSLGKTVIQRNPFTNGYRVYLDFTPGDEPLSELRCALRSGAKPLGETWTYQWRKEKY
jgi:periplasmic glucans biosynthesis protein